MNLHKTIWLVLSLGLMGGLCSAQTQIDLVAPEAPKNLDGYFYIYSESSDNLISRYYDYDNTQFALGTSDTLNDNSEVQFAGVLGDDVFFQLTVGDAGPRRQFSLVLTHFLSEGLQIAAGQLRFGVTGLSAVDPLVNLAATFTVDSGSVDSTYFPTVLTAHYDALTGDFYFTNHSDIILPPLDPLLEQATFLLEGNFIAVPEPANTVALFAVIALVATLSQRRRSFGD